MQILLQKNVSQLILTASFFSELCLSKDYKSNLPGIFSLFCLGYVSWRAWKQPFHSNADDNRFRWLGQGLERNWRGTAGAFYRCPGRTWLCSLHDNRSRQYHTRHWRHRWFCQGNKSSFQSFSSSQVEYNPQNEILLKFIGSLHISRLPFCRCLCDSPCSGTDAEVWNLETIGNCTVVYRSAAPEKFIFRSRPLTIDRA